MVCGLVDAWVSGPVGVWAGGEHDARGDVGAGGNRGRLGGARMGAGVSTVDGYRTNKKPARNQGVDPSAARFLETLGKIYGFLI